MSHYAKVLNNKVINVIVAEEDFFETFIDDSPGEWIQTSYNTLGNIHYVELEDGTKIPSNTPEKALRYNYAQMGGNYDKEADAFYNTQPYSSWILNTDTYIWEAPIAFPNDGANYTWDEDNQQWTVI